MRNWPTALRGADWLDRATAAALLVAAATALTVAVRLGGAACSGGEELLAAMREQTARRVAVEREQIRPALEAAARGDRAGARREAEAALGRLPDNSQLHLLLAGVLRERGETVRSLAEYRRAVELVRDLADRRSPQFIGATLSPWLREVRPTLAGGARDDLYYLERALAGGCS
jgi:hypothetical protein